MPDQIRRMGWKDEFAVRAIGIRLDRMRCEARATCVAFPSLIDRHAPSIQAVASQTLSVELANALRSSDRIPADLLDLREAIYQLVEPLAQQVLDAHRGDHEDVLVVGCHGTGIWLEQAPSEGSYLELLDAGRLAEALGKSVVADFPSRHLARQGGNEFLERHGLGLLLADRDSRPGYRSRGILEFTGDHIRLTCVPPLPMQHHSRPIRVDEIALGTRLLSDLRMFCETRKPDVEQSPEQATAIHELLELWRKATSDVGNGDTGGCLPLIAELRNSPFQDRHSAEILATAREFLVSQAVDQLLKRVPAHTPIGELLVMGEAVQDAALMNTLATFVSFLPMRRLEGLGQDRTLLAASVAALAMLHLWHVPLASANGQETPRVLGTLTPGNPANWRRVLTEMTSSVPGVLPLREAV